MAEVIPTNHAYADVSQYEEDSEENVYDENDNDDDEYNDNEYDDSDDNDYDEDDNDDEKKADPFYSECIASIPKTEYTYTGKNIRPKVTVKNKNGIVLSEGKDYSVKYGCQYITMDKILETATSKIGTYNISIRGKSPYTFEKLLSYYISSPKNLNTVTAKPLNKKNYLLDSFSFVNKLPKLKSGMNKVKIKEAKAKNKIDDEYLNCVKYVIPKTGDYAFAFSDLRVSDSSHIYMTGATTYEREGPEKRLWVANTVQNDFNTKYNWDRDIYKRSDQEVSGLERIFTSNWEKQLNYYVNTTWEDYFKSLYSTKKLYDKYHESNRYRVTNDLIDDWFAPSGYVDSEGYGHDPDRLVYYSCYSHFKKGDIVYLTIPNPTQLNWYSGEQIYYHSNSYHTDSLYSKQTCSACTLNVEVKYLGKNLFPLDGHTGYKKRDQKTKKVHDNL